LPTAAVKDVAILAGVTIVKMPRTFLAAFAGLFRHETFVAMGKPLELDAADASPASKQTPTQAKIKTIRFMNFTLFAAQTRTR
jgi:hypothetical protein